MASGDASPIIKASGFTLSPPADPGYQDQLLYTVDPNVPERIESVSFSVDYQGSVPSLDQYVVILAAQNGAVVDVIAAPPIHNPDNAVMTAHLAWFRRGNDSANTPLVVSAPFNFAGRQVFATMALPDLVLQTSSTVTLRLYGNLTTEEPTVSISDCTLTTTRNAGAVSTTTEMVLDTQPILVSGPG